ncbi:uncharacterized protein LOC126698499 isoform X2 [Quercus robur]|uniref:uncharacterized protein LOC126698499 isoform X2 n=1 Tax=Quercus robur TaxID=38942 RepID=UPI0021636B73|nr:uncharacterized protein LOC126698499 isoform X2 [Quercus robur]XP_050251727.1 uncharacterized protein LOC126698499 isoform X2 [Quercus robur]
MSRGSRSSGSRGFSSGSGFGFGFRGRRARNSDTLDVEVNELEDLHRRSHEAEASGNEKPLGFFVKLTGAAAEAAAKEGKPLAYDDRHEIRQMFVPPNPHMCNKINNFILELVSRFGEDYEDKDYFEYMQAHYCGLNKAIDENMQTKQQDLARNSKHDLLDMHDLMFAII